MAEPTPPHVVVSGASVAGLAAAYWFAELGWRVTVVERSEEFRRGGQNIDVRGLARDVVERMGLFGAIKDANTTETGTVIADGRNRVVAALPDDDDGATAELEVLRGDLAEVLRAALPEAVEWVFGQWIEVVEGGDGVDGVDGVTVVTDDGRRFAADLLVVAEGVRSSTRELVFGDEARLDEIGVTMVFGTIPRTADDDTRWRWYNATGRRQAHLRPDNHGTTRAILAYADGPRLAGADRADLLRELSGRFADAGWQSRRILDGFATSEDVYADDLAQVHAASWSRSRICLLGDAAWCVTPIGGGGASLALIGAYVRAAEVGGAPSVEHGLRDYETFMRPLVRRAQKLPPGLRSIAYPRTRLALLLRAGLLKALTSAPLRPLAARMGHVADFDVALPPLPTRSAPR